MNAFDYFFEKKISDLDRNFLVGRGGSHFLGFVCTVDAQVGQISDEIGEGKNVMLGEALIGTMVRNR